MSSDNSSDFLDQWLFDTFETSPSGLADYRFVFAAFFIIFVAPSPGSKIWLGQLPADLYAPPPGPMMLLDGFPPGAVMYGLSVGAIVGGLALFMGLRARYTALLVAAMITLHHGFYYATGKISHGQHLMFTVLLLLPLYGWGDADRQSAGADDEPGGFDGDWSMSLLALFVGFSMMTAGFLKLLGGWLLLEDHAIQNYLYKNIEIHGRVGLLTAEARQWFGPIAWEFLDWATVIFEIGFLPAALSKRWFRRFCAAGVFFHAGTLLVLTIPFSFQLIAYAAFIDWDEVAERLPHIRQARRWVESGSRDGTWSRFLGRAAVSVGALLAVRFLAQQYLVPIEVGGSRLSAFVIAALSVATVIWMASWKFSASPGTQATSSNPAS